MKSITKQQIIAILFLISCFIIQNINTSKLRMKAQLRSLLKAQIKSTLQNTLSLKSQSKAQALALAKAQSKSQSKSQSQSKVQAKSQSQSQSKAKAKGINIGLIVTNNKTNSTNVTISVTDDFKNIANIDTLMSQIDTQMNDYEEKYLDILNKTNLNDTEVEKEHNKNFNDKLNPLVKQLKNQLEKNSKSKNATIKEKNDIAMQNIDAYLKNEIEDYNQINKELNLKEFLNTKDEYDDDDRGDFVTPDNLSNDEYLKKMKKYSHLSIEDFTKMSFAESNSEVLLNSNSRFGRTNSNNNNKKRSGLRLRKMFNKNHVHKGYRSILN